MKTLRGGCHCGAVQFSVEVEGDDPLDVVRCNCSICRMTGFLHLIVPKSRFQLRQGEAQLSLYTFNTGIAKHFFCKVCGIKPFYVPRSNPDGFDVNVHCLEPVPANLKISEFDGQNWEQHGDALAHLSRG